MPDLLSARGHMLCLLSLLIGCGTLVLADSVPESIVFPYEWVGNIDKQRFNEPSGICWHAARKTLFVVGDEGDICEIRTDGTLIKQKRIRRADFEGVTHNPATGLLYVAIEGAERIIEVDPESFAVLREFPLPRAFEDKVIMKAGGQGIEALTFVPDAEHPEGGTFLVANQAFSLKNAQDRSVICEVELPLRSRAGGAKLLSSFEPGIIDLAGLYRTPSNGHIFVISDACNVLLEYDAAYRLLNQFAFPGDNQEGIAADDAGFMYIAQDSGGIIKLKWLRAENVPPADQQ